MQLRQIDTERKQDVERFVQFPFKLYRRCPQWVPPLLEDARATLDRRKNPSYKHSTADFFIVENGKEVLGRMMVVHNRNHNAYRGEKTAFFNSFECVEDIAVARLLFAAAFEWARARGLEKMIGTRGFIGSDGSGILVEGFEHRPAMGVPYNYPYYDAFVTDAGFEKDTDHISGHISGSYELPARVLQVADKVQKRHNLWIKNFTSKDEMRQWAPRVLEVYQDSFTETHEFYPPSPEEAQSIANGLITLCDPRLIKLVMKGDDIVGFVFAYHDLSAALQKCQGRLWPVGWFFLMQEPKRTEWVNLNGIGFLPAYRGLGGNALLYRELFQSIKQFNFKHGDIVQVNEVNFPSKSDMETLGVTWYKRHRSYKRNL